MQKLFYLASPYTHTNKNVERERYEKIEEVAASFIKKNIHIFCPISYSHPLAINHNISGDFLVWKDLDENFISRCDGVIVYTMDGWKESKGVAAETVFAIKNSIPVYYFDPSIDIEEFIRNVLND